VLLTGLHLMRTSEVEANLPRLNETARLPYIPDLIARKLAGPEHGTLDNVDVAFHRAEYERLYSLLEESRTTSHLPREARSTAALHDLLVRLRLADAGR
jgi:uncharacterized protein